jgi:hypothetical protein
VSSLPPLPDAELGLYRHYKGGEYLVMGVVRHSESLEPMVLYRPLYDGSGLWVRPFAMFFETVDVDGSHRLRFDRIASAAEAGETELASTVNRMESRLSALDSAPVRSLMQSYRQVAERFERDLSVCQRDVLLAKASALMLVQAAAAADGAVPAGDPESI